MSQFVYLDTLPVASGSVDTGFKALNLANTYGLNVSVKTDVNGTLNLYWSNSASGTPVATTDTDSITTFDHSKQYKVKGKYVKLEFTNGSGAVNNTIFNLKATIIEENIISNLPMDVNIISGASGGDASSANQLITHTKLDTIDTTLNGVLVVNDPTSQTSLNSIDTKITACDTSALATEATLTTLNGKVVACDTSALATEATLTTLNGKVVACDTSALATEATLTTLNGKVVACDTSALATEATLSGMATDVATLANTVNAGGEQKVSVSSENIGSHNNVANNITLNAGATTTALNISEIAEGSLFYEDSSTSTLDGLEIQVSVDNSNWYKWGNLAPYQEAGASVRTANVLGGSAHGLRYIRLKNTSATDNYTNVNATIAGSH